MNRFLLAIVLSLCAAGVWAQGQVRGKVLDRQSDETLQFVNIRVTDSQGKLAGGGMTDVSGNFAVRSLRDGQYTLEVSFVGYKTVTRKFSITPQKRTAHFNALYLAEDTKTLGEVTVTGQRSQMKLEVDRKTFTVDEVLAAAGGSASELLENIPSVEVTTDGEISLRGNSSVEVWINGKASGLTADNRGEILQQIPAESIERIEVIDNPSAKYSPEGSAGIINIILKRDRKAGYYGSLQTGANNQKGWNVGGNINYSSGHLDAYANLGYRRRRGSGGNMSDQRYRTAEELPFSSYQYSEGDNNNHGGGLFGRAGLTWHLTEHDDLGLAGMTMHGNRENDNLTDYTYGTYDALGNAVPNRALRRQTWGDGKNHMYNGELTYSHKFGADTHKIDFSLSFNKWTNDGSNEYLNDTTHLGTLAALPPSYAYQYRPMETDSRTWEAKLDYENQISDKLKLEAGYNGRFSHEDTPQQSYEYAATGTAERLDPHDARLKEDAFFYNQFVYDMDVHALYATLNTKFGPLGVMAGLRGEYWRVDTHDDRAAAAHHHTVQEGLLPALPLALPQLPAHRDGSATAELHATHAPAMGRTAQLLQEHARRIDDRVWQP